MLDLVPKPHMEPGDEEWPGTTLDLDPESAERLARIKTCEETGGEAPCKIGEIILEAESESATGEVWRRQQ